MKVQVLSIQSAIAPNTHEVVLSVGTDTQKFIFTTEVNRVGEHLLQTTRGDRTFSEFFKFNQRVAMNVTNLVVKYYNRETVNLPADVGVLVTQETALSKQKPFENNSLADTESQLPTAVDGETRQRAIAILEQLPEAVLDEAVKFLESLYVKCDRLQ
ncbi:MAG: hypothetical protein JGK24_03560 [Microcoleus sp. PH2017_29_MFU_D_A]|uniref:hypothetical protein n=1 Tax=unclassified Microcoleus TaxID=2642155 RepID=UPI001D7AD5C3|nr:MULTISPECIES: hypothetical protein [unclassified Microcoleus]MCC3506283.1 hypothetical protein [Microcoleus sp. PH2017_19_SFW_U_A]MCC3553977.1 hypothetical protein [Microcoleus sp. PH2017_35_SFW_U_B]MCC3582577.1 hypothetical protein [Microcoleus sp. PH2017_30_WIL_O_A]TAE15984.1 MAG: hypothetical protein EAZ94_02935 [Oscillatoriales cyanobacterium]MCC3422955.1 hypothetical protein [Microcoleus sp. PH2017_01_SCD_O_A]